MSEISTDPTSATPPTSDRAAEVASSAKDQAATVAHTAMDEVQSVGAEAAQEAKDLLADASEQLKAQAAEQSDRVAAMLGDVGSQLRTMADAGDAGVARDLVQRVAGEAEQLADRLGQGGLDRTLDEARRLARNRPGMFLLGAAAAGFFAARLARTADTHALVEATNPSDGSSNGSANGAGLQPGRAAELAPRPQQAGTTSGPGITAPLPTDGRP
jgi:hypothetical protein